MNSGEIAKLLKGYTGVAGADSEGVVRQIPGKDDARIQRQPGMDHSHHIEHQRRTVGGQRIVEARRDRQLIGFREVLAQSSCALSGVIRRR